MDVTDGNHHLISVASNDKKKVPSRCWFSRERVTTIKQLNVMRPKIIPPEVLTQLLSEKFVNRFWSNVEIKGPDECWPWKRYVKPNGYGVYLVGQRFPTATNFYTHRLAWIISNQKNIPDGLFILHSCIDRKSCCNPNHLRAGTPHDNNMDTVAQKRGNQRQGEAHHGSKITEKDVKEIRAKHADGSLVIAESAAHFGVSSRTIIRVIKRIGWRHI